MSELSGEICGSLASCRASRSSILTKGFSGGDAAACAAGTWIVAGEETILSLAIGRGSVAISSFSIIMQLQ